MKFYLVCTVPRLGFGMAASGDSMDVADACFAYETAVGTEIYIIKKICAPCDKNPGLQRAAAVKAADRPFQGGIYMLKKYSLNTMINKS